MQIQFCFQNKMTVNYATQQCMLESVFLYSQDLTIHAENILKLYYLYSVHIRVTSG